MQLLGRESAWGAEGGLVIRVLVAAMLSTWLLGCGGKVVIPLEEEEQGGWSPAPFQTRRVSGANEVQEAGDGRGTEDLESVEVDPVEEGSEDGEPLLHSTANNDNDYLDDGVTFVTDEEVLYDDHTPTSSNPFPHTSTYLQRGRESRVGGAGHWTEKCPPLPDTSASGVNLGLCEMRRCVRDEECSRDGSVVCCYNGCIYSCLPKVNPPVAFDWLEETELKAAGSGDNETSFGSKNLRNLLDSSVSPDEIALPGGCYINSQQYEDLILFRKFEHVKSCTCSKGEVFCEVNTEATPTERSPADEI